ncbi:unnamed protein product [Lactuca virosa]|uniref:Uncharacterized protein n=1 Tax=Lactuca virosa TaxID=75947 RepID=A0AAU9MXV0_9ASTR|nr:unnamed protein product [Lactuca virosa]
MPDEFNITWLHRRDPILNQYGGYCANQERNLRKAAAQEVVDKVRQHNGLLVDQVYYPKFLSLVSAYCNNLVELEVKNTWLSVDHMNQMLMIRKVDPTLDMEADEGDNYTHIPVRNRVG